MKNSEPFVVIGLGQLGSLFSVSFLRLGHPVYPILKGDSPSAMTQHIQPKLVLAAVGEEALPGVLENLPEPWRDRVVLLSNELLPQTWQAFDIPSPTVISVQFEKKDGKPVGVDHPSPVFGPLAGTVLQALDELDIPGREVTDRASMTRELVLKNLYILTLNLAGLETGASAAQLLGQHRGLTEQIWAELFAVQQAMVDIRLDREEVKQATMEYLDRAPKRGAGRSAPERLERTLIHAHTHGVEVSTLERIKEERST
jgi:ketopantoate reductase